VNIDNNRIRVINNRWGNQIDGLRNWPAHYPNRIAGWNRWGNGVRRNWYHHHHHHGWFGRDWWSRHDHPIGGWSYFYAFGRYPYRYWWTVPTYAALVNWFTWSAPANVWAEPIYYDYGSGGNVVYENNVVYVNGQEVAPAEEYAQDVATLATAPPPASEEQAEAAEWMPLGTFAISTSENDVDPSRVIQLAVNKEGIISGTLYNTQTDETQTVQGRVDKQTQRVAFRIGESDDVFVETGLYNLTQDEAPVMVHFGPDRVENWLLVRLEQPKSES